MVERNQLIRLGITIDDGIRIAAGFYGKTELGNRWNCKLLTARHLGCCRKGWWTGWE